MYSFQPIIRLYPPLHLLNFPFYLRLLHRKPCTGLSYTRHPFRRSSSLFPVNRSFERISSTRESSSPSNNFLRVQLYVGKELRGNKTRQDEVSLVSSSRSFCLLLFFLLLLPRPLRRISLCSFFVETLPCIYVAVGRCHPSLPFSSSSSRLLLLLLEMHSEYRDSR